MKLNVKWLALARESLIRAEVSPSEADSVIDSLNGDHRDITDDQREWAFNTMGNLSESVD